MDGGAGASAIPVYNKFVELAKAMRPEYISMIMPSRWFAGGRGLDVFRETMLKSKQMKAIHDFPNATEVFPNIEIKGGVNYFLWDKNYKGDCFIKTYEGGRCVSALKRPLKEKDTDVFIRHNEAISIIRKVRDFKEKSFNEIVSSLKPFGLRTFFRGEETYFKDSVKVYVNGGIDYINKKDITQNQKWVDEYKVFIGRAYGAGEGFPHQILNYPILGEPNTCCTETYLVIGPFLDEKKCLNVMSYIKTKFFRFLVLAIKNTQDAPKRVYQFVPQQDFDEEWTDEKLYKKYRLTPEEIAYIEKMIRPME